MAGKMDSLMDTLTCPVCFEEFEENGDHVPRLLPCTHTLCHTCIGQWIQDKRLECPTCRMKHEATNEEMSFPQNKYILTMMRRRTEAGTDSKICLEHDKDEILFCRETGCQKSICISCLSTTHLGHKVVALEEETKEILIKMLDEVEVTRSSLTTMTTKVTDASAKAVSKTKSSLEQLKQKKEEVVRKFDKMIQEAEDHMKELNVTSPAELSIITENLKLLNEIKKTCADEENTYADVSGKLETVESVKHNAAQLLSKVGKYEYAKYIANQDIYIGEMTMEQRAVFDITAFQGQGK